MHVTPASDLSQGRKFLQKVSLGQTTCSPHGIEELLQEVRYLLDHKKDQPRSILCINSHIYNLVMVDPDLRRHLDGARINAADGMSIVWASRLFGPGVLSRCNMTEAFRAFLLDSRFPPSTGVLIGCSESEAGRAAAYCNEISQHCRIVQSCSGYFSEEQYTSLFLEQRHLDFIFIGMGTPRSEKIAALAAQCCPEAIVWHVGGGTIRIFAGGLREAPVLWRRLGLQWFYRLLQEPRSLWKRYFFGNPLFCWRILMAKLSRRNV